MANSHSLGRRGERQAVEYLARKGYTILRTNWSTKHREIDIIAEDDSFIIFIEVKTRMAGFTVHPREAVSVPKQRNIISAAQSFLRENNIDKEARFDIITIIKGGEDNELEHIMDAFYPTL
ncbi:MAG: YraN family protein [Bacteroidales bacterium]|jgi:putative endonuclease|nr:YraN family protein [Bacteroidales bacterium]